RTGCCRTTLVAGTSSWGSGSAFARPSPRKPRFSVPFCPVSGVAFGALPDVAAGRDEVRVRVPLDALAALIRAAASADVRPVDVPVRAPAALAVPAVLAPLAWRAVACPAEPGRAEPDRAEPDAVRDEAPVPGLGLAVALLAAVPIGSQFLNMKYCWPSVHRLVVTQYSTRPYCQYSPVSEKNGTMYCMNFCDWAIGLSGSTVPVCMSPRLALCRTVMNVVVELTTTVRMITMITCSGGVGWAKRNLSPRCTPKIFASCALCTIGWVNPYLSGEPCFQ